MRLVRALRIGPLVLIAGIVTALISMVTLQRLILGWYGPQVRFDSSDWKVDPLPSARASVRQKMIRDLVLNVLPGKSRAEIEELLGKSPTHEDMRRNRPEDFLVRKKNPDGTWQPYPKTGAGYYDDELNWDLYYVIGTKEQTFCESILPDPSREVLLIRFGTNGTFSSWYVIGSSKWPRIVGRQGKSTYRRHGTQGEP